MTLLILAVSTYTSYRAGMYVGLTVSPILGVVVAIVLTIAGAALWGKPRSR